MTQEINIPHIDGKIWNAEYCVIKIIEGLAQTGKVTIILDNEGSDAEQLGLYRILDNICSTLNYNPADITIQTLNQLESHPTYNIVKGAPLYINSGQHFAQKNVLPEKDVQTFKHFGIFIGRSSWQRLWVASHMWANYKDKIEITYHYDSSLSYHRSHLSFDELSYQIGLTPAVELTKDFLTQLPIKNDFIDRYPILTPAHFSIAKVYHKFFAEIVCETFLAGHSFYPTEKTWRPLICKTPFLTIGPKDHLLNLRKLGFKTFSNWWDESYDEDVHLDNGKVSIRNILSTVDRLAKMNKQNLISMHQDMKPTLDHNYNRFMELSNSDFSKIFKW
jgi:hypothetical protein